MSVVWMGHECRSSRRDMNAGQENRQGMGCDPFGLQVKSETSKSSNMHLNFGSLTIKKSDLEIL